MNSTPFLSGRDRRALLGGGVCLTVLLTLSRGLPAAHRVEVAARARQSDVIRRWNLVRAADVDPGARLILRQMALAWRARCLIAATPDAASAALIQHVSRLATFSGAEVLVATPAASPEAVDGTIQVALRVSLIGDFRAVFALIRELELGDPDVEVRRFVITQSDLARRDNALERLRVELEIAAIAILDRAAPSA